MYNEVMHQHVQSMVIILHNIYLYFYTYVSLSLDLVYICGGFDGQECLQTAEYYDPVTNQWTMIQPMRSRRSGVG